MANPGDRMMNMQQTADYLGISVLTLYNWRAKRISPPSYKLGKKVVFRMLEVERWLQLHKQVFSESMA